MKTMRTWFGMAVLVVAGPLLADCVQEPLAADSRGGTGVAALRSLAVAGSGIHYFSTAIVHSQTPTPAGMTQLSSDIVELAGDLEGYLLYHVTSSFDFHQGTLVNTGTQLFSGTIAGSEPVLLHDATFRFDVDLWTGATLGVVELRRSKDAPHKGYWYNCDLVVVGTGMTAEGNASFDYSGVCTRYGIPRENAPAG